MLVFIENIHSSDSVRRLDKLRWSAAKKAALVLLEQFFVVVQDIEADMHLFLASVGPRVGGPSYPREAEHVEHVV